ncbi:MAG TPA: T9SS type A sorting domain-containing protein [Caldithrix abyssi]|uniref:T9SS type A sorting domain-containing protein n=1 Tax=Caldithrix abyssi TaxID=187145 RepID=A0A7V5LJY3_CALAY|nr:T9SS type A sorting domain-containing protein [Caldithrix abyssi]
MRFLISIIFIAFLGLQNLTAQSDWQMVTVSDTVVDFGSVTAYQQHEQILTIHNNSDQVVQVLSADFEENVFSTDLNPVPLSPQSDMNFSITFESDQNVNYTDFLHIELDHGIHPIIIETSAQANYEESYYNATQNKWGSDLKSALHNIIKGHTQYSYSDLWDILSDTDEDPANPNNVILIYTGWSYPKSNHGGNADQWNREHVWAKSHGDFGTTPPAGSDVHHIRPCDVSVNSKRGNLDFDNGGSLYTDPDGVTNCYYDGDSWEPRDEDKGDVARMMYYMVVRYEGEEGYDLELVDYTPSTTSSDPVFGKKSTLYDWHWIDTVDSWERSRNDRIYNNWQHNRNPFIDHPEFVDRLPSISGLPVPSDPELVVSPLQVTMDTVGINTPASYYLAIINTGVQDLEVSNIQSTNPQFTVDQSNMLLSPENYAYLTVHFTGSGVVGNYSTEIQLTTNDPDEGFIQVPITIHVQETASFVDLKNFPKTFLLQQNFPNPFNPQTTIKYVLNQNTMVKLTVFDASGKIIANLVNKKQKAGVHKVHFNADGLASGIYYYQIIAGRKRAVKKMVLMK